MFSKNSNFVVYQNYLIGVVRGNIDRVVRGRITIGRQKRDRDNGERCARDEPKDGARDSSLAPASECTYQTIFSNQTRCRPGPGPGGQPTRQTNVR